MRELERHVGSVHNLVIFEAAARLASFSAAARELGITRTTLYRKLRRGA